MAAANSKTSAAQLGKLETEMKTAFKEGRWEVVRKKADEIRKADPQNRTVERILQKTQEEEKAALKKANAMKIKSLEVKMDQSFRAGDLAAMTQAMEEVKKLDPANAKAMKAEAAISKAKSILEAEIRKEKIRKLSAEVEFFANKADWNQAVTKANELLSVEWDSSVALKVLKKVAIAKKVNYMSLITIQAPKVEKKLGFFARLFGKKTPVSANVSLAPAKEPPRLAAVPIVTKSETSVLKPIAPAVVVPAVLAKPAAPMVIPTHAKPIVEAKPVAPIPVPSAPKPSVFGSSFAKKEEPKAVAVTLPLSIAKPAVLAQAKPTVAQEAKKAEPAKAIPVKVEQKSGFFARLFAKKPMSPAKESPKLTVTPVVTKAVTKETAKIPTVDLKLVSKLATAVDTKPMASAPIPSAPKTSVFGSLLAKKEEPKPAMAPIAISIGVPLGAPTGAPIGISPTPMKPEIKTMPSVVAPVVTKIVTKPMESQLKVEQKTVTKPETKNQEKGNIFTSLFGKEEEPGTTQKPSVSVLETIVAKTAPTQSDAKKEKVPEERTGETFLGFAKMFFRFSIAFIAISAAFFYIENMDTGNAVLGVSFINKENNAIQLHNAALKIEEKQAAVKNYNEEIGKYQGGYVDDHQEVIKKIVANRMDWPAILKKLNEVTESVYEKNAFSQYVQYNNYNYNTETGQLSVSGTLSDPLGKNLTKLAELEEAFRTFPKDPANPTDERKPYFYGLQEFKSFSKNFNAASGRFQSTFNLTLSTKEPKK